MSKDPAFLFYPGDWLGGTLTFNRSHKGAYMDLLMAQHSSGHMTIDDIKTVLGTDFDSMWESKLKNKFKQDENGLYFNQKLEDVINDRTSYKQSRLDNLKGKKGHKAPHMDVSYGNTVCGNGNGNINKIDIDIINSQFEVFRQDYPGTKRGHKIELENLKKKHKDWIDIVPKLSDALSYQINARDIKRKAGGFIPEWKHLQTWINQRCWEEEINNNQTEELIPKFSSGPGR